MKTLIKIFMFVFLTACTKETIILNQQEIGTWTPSIVDVGGTATYVINNLQDAEFTKDGGVVFFQAVMDDIETTGTPTGQLTIEGLPYILSSENNVDVFFFANGSVDFYYINGRITGLGNNPSILFYKKDEFTPDYEGVFYNDLNGADLRISGFYFIE